MKSSSFILFLCIISLVTTQDYNVRDFGAVGDGKTDDILSIRKAFAAATSSNRGRVIFDSGYTFVTGGVNVTSNIIIDVRGKILGSSNINDYEWTPSVWHPLFRADHQSNITITGGGVIDGNGAFWWGCAFNTSLYPCLDKQRPILFDQFGVSDLIFHNVTLQNSPMFNIHMYNTSNVHIYNITIFAPPSHDSHSPARNTDGIDVGNSRDVLIENSYISVGDVAMTIGSNSIISENVLVRNLTIGTSHGLALGSYTYGGIRNVTFDNIVIHGSDPLDAGPNILTQKGRGGLVENITYSNIKMYNVGYCISLNMNFSQDGDNATTNIPKYKNINIHDIYCENSTNGWWLDGLDESEIEANFYNIQMVNIKRTFAVCTNIYGSCDNSTVFPSCPPCMGTSLCEDTSLDCSNYLGLCNNPAYHTTLCKQCKRTCNLCNSCNN